jgi:hypothetical protein
MNKFFLFIDDHFLCLPVAHTDDANAMLRLSDALTSDVEYGCCCGIIIIDAAPKIEYCILIYVRIDEMEDETNSNSLNTSVSVLMINAQGCDDICEWRRLLPLV